MTRKARLNKLEKDLCGNGIPGAPSPWDRRMPTREECEEAYQLMLVNLRDGRDEPYADGAAVFAAMCANRTPEQFESDILKHCGPAVLQMVLGKKPS